VARVSGAEVPAPYARNLELAAFPNEDMVADAARQALYLEV
jgi:pyruvate dehydrogenase E1 component beta subunit